MNLKTYQAYSMAEALAAVKKDLGVDAIILNTRSFKRGGLLGLGSRTIVELTASANADVNADVNAATTTPARTSIASAATSGQRRRAQRAYGITAVSPRDARSTASAASTAPTAQDRDRTKRLAQAMLEQHRRKGLAEDAQANEVAVSIAGSVDGSVDGSVAGSVDRSVDPGEATPEPMASPAPASASASAPGSMATSIAAIAPPQTAVAQRYMLSAPPDGPAAESATPDSLLATPSAGTSEIGLPQRVASAITAPAPPTRRGPVALARVAPAIPAEDESVRAELGAIRKMVGEVLQRQSPHSGVPTPTMPERLFDMYLKMIGQEVSEELADQVVNEVRDELTAMELEDGDAVRAAVRRSLADFIPTDDEAMPTGPRDGRPLTIVLIGPTGVGKTTTLAKVAASFKLRHGRKVGLITADTYRIAAVDQLRTYANIIGLPLQVTLTPSEMRHAVHAMRDQDVILIDTAGRSQNDPDRIQELKSFVDAANPHEVHLVLSSTAGEKVLMREAEAFGDVGVDKVVLTKLDEAVSFGMLVNVVRKIGKNLSFFTTGQEVPDQIEVSRPERLAELILGADVHS